MQIIANKRGQLMSSVSKKIAAQYSKLFLGGPLFKNRLSRNIYSIKKKEPVMCLSENGIA